MENPTPDQMDALHADRGMILENTKRPDEKGELTLPPFPVYVGIDTAKSPDQTIVTIIRDNTDLKVTELCAWLALPGENYEDQFDIIVDFFEMYENIRVLTIDSTGQGDFMPDKFQRHTSYNIERINFSPMSKDLIYKNLLQVVQNKLTTIPNLDGNKCHDDFRFQMLDLQKEYKGRFMSCHHPDSPDAHDDYPDSWALSEWGMSIQKQREPNIRSL